VHKLPAYQCGVSVETKFESPNGGKILCPSTVGKGSSTDQFNSFFLFSAMFLLELIEAIIKKEDSSRMKTISKANDFALPRLIFFFGSYLYNPC
jgi:hypothetical protein